MSDQPKNVLLTTSTKGSTEAPAAAAATNGGEYPKWKYSKAMERTVLTREQENALGEGWYNSPAELQAALDAVQPLPVPSEKAPQAPEQPVAAPPAAPEVALDPDLAAKLHDAADLLEKAADKLDGDEEEIVSEK